MKKTEQNINSEEKREPRKRLRVIGIVLITLIVCQLIGGRVYMMIDENNIKKDPGNAEKYSLKNAGINENSSLEGKNILFLGSSVTLGTGALNISFADYLATRNNFTSYKYAVGATTLVDEMSILAFLASGDGDSYIQRIIKIDKNLDVDCLVCQLSTNDASMKKELGVISDSFNKGDFNTKTITGAMEYIIAYAEEVWECPVIFYTGAYYDSPEYAAMVNRLMELTEKWNIGVIDMYSDKEFNNIDSESYELYMRDKIHPTQAGYLLWWTPYIEKKLEEFL